MNEINILLSPSVTLHIEIDSSNKTIFTDENLARTATHIITALMERGVKNLKFLQKETPFDTGAESVESCGHRVSRNPNFFPTEFIAVLNKIIQDLSVVQRHDQNLLLDLERTDEKTTDNLFGDYFFLNARIVNSRN
jgi:hypothetical protein